MNIIYLQFIYYSTANVSPPKTLVILNYKQYIFKKLRKTDQTV